MQRKRKHSPLGTVHMVHTKRAGKDKGLLRITQLLKEKNAKGNNYATVLMPSPQKVLKCLHQRSEPFCSCPFGCDTHRVPWQSMGLGPAIGSRPGVLGLQLGPP